MKKCFMAVFLWFVATLVVRSAEYSVEVFIIEKIGEVPFFFTYKEGDGELDKLRKEASFSAKIPVIKAGETVKVARNSKTFQIPLRGEKGEVVDFDEYELGESITVFVGDSVGRRTKCEISYHDIKREDEAVLQGRHGKTSKRPSFRDKGLSTKFDALYEHWQAVSAPTSDKSKKLIVALCKVTPLAKP